MSKIKTIDTVRDFIQQLADEARLTGNTAAIRQINELITDPDLTWAHGTPGTRDVGTAPNDLWEAGPNRIDSMFHVGTPRAASDRLEQVSDTIYDLEARHKAVDSGNFAEADVIDQSNLTPARTVPVNLRLNPDEIAWVHDYDLSDPAGHIGSILDPLGKAHPLNEGMTEVPLPNASMVGKGKSYTEAAEQELADKGYKALAYFNDVEDPGSVSIVPTGKNTVFNAITGERIKEAASPIAVGGLLGASGNTEAADYSFDMPGTNPERFIKEEPKSRVGLPTELAAKGLAWFGDWRNRLNRDIREEPLKTAASIPIGAVEGAWDTVNLLGTGHYMLDKFVNDLTEPSSIEKLTELSKDYKEEFSDFFDEKGFSGPARNVGEITGVGGLSTKAAKKAGQGLYRFYDL